MRAMALFTAMLSSVSLPCPMLFQHQGARSTPWPACQGFLRAAGSRNSPSPCAQLQGLGDLKGLRVPELG